MNTTTPAPTQTPSGRSVRFIRSGITSKKEWKAHHLRQTGFRIMVFPREWPNSCFWFPHEKAPMTAVPAQTDE